MASHPYYRIVCSCLCACALLFVGCSSEETAPESTGQGTESSAAEHGETTGGETTGGTGQECTPTAASGQAEWQVLQVCAPGELLSVWAGSRDDVWAVGAGGSVLRFDGCTWSRPDAGTDADLWWVFGLPDETVFASGANGTVLRRSNGTWEALETATSATIFGLWGSAADDVWAVGFDQSTDGSGTLLHFDGTAFSAVTDLPPEAAGADLFKVWGAAADDVWVVGREDVLIHWDGTAWTAQPSGLTSNWVTVTGAGEHLVVVGGKSNGALIERRGGDWVDLSPDFLQPLQGACFQPDGQALATGLGATFLRRDAEGTWSEDWDAPFDVVNPTASPVPGCSHPTPDYHACAADGAGGFYVAGGHFFGPLTEGALLYYGPLLPTEGL